MPIPGEQPDPLAIPSESSPVRRRLAAQYVRDARDRLVSTTGTRPFFDLELLRQYAQTRLSASLVIILLVATIGFLSSLWSGATAAGAWTAAVLVIHLIIVSTCRRFLADHPTEADAKRWRLRFIILDLFYGLAWMFILVHPVGTDESSSTFMLFIMLLVVAVSSMLASSLPMAVYAATIPVTAAIALNFVFQGTLRDYILAAMAVTAQGYFALLAYRLHSTTLATLMARAEKDALIGELEQAKAISDDARQRAEAANISKSRFLAQMSHELRTPLNAVIGFSEVIGEGFYGPPGHPKYVEYARDIAEAGRSLHAKIGDILEFANIEAGRYPMAPQPLELAELLQACIDEQQGRAFSRRIDLAFGFAEPGMVRADPRALKRIFGNLLVNALDYTPDGGRVRVEIRGKGITLVATIADSGTGFAAKERERAGLPFQRFDRPGCVTGAGLGLAIAMELARRVGGALRLASGPGSGAVMELRLLRYDPPR